MVSHGDVGYWENECTLSVMLGKTLAKVENLDGDRVLFTLDDGSQFNAYHLQDCCEDVNVHSIVGNLDDIIGVPLITVETSTFKNCTPSELSAECVEEESFTWTLHTLATERGRVVIRWLGTSNGYYGESVYFGRC